MLPRHLFALGLKIVTLLFSSVKWRSFLSDKYQMCVMYISYIVHMFSFSMFFLLCFVQLKRKCNDLLEATGRREEIECESCLK